jgi:hypothetical protein
MKMYPPKLIQCSKVPAANFHQCDENHNVEPHTICGGTTPITTHMKDISQYGRQQ